MNISDFISKNKKIVSVLFLFILTILFIVVVQTVINNGQEQEPDSNFIPLDAPATLLNSEDLYSELEINQFEQFRNDLTNYARNYKKVNENIITYKLVGEIEKQNDILVYSVESINKPVHKLEVTLQKKPQQRISLSLKDLATNTTEFDNSLYSNSKRNVYISTLPLNNVLYSIDFDQTSDKFLVVLYERSDTANKAALEALKSGTGDENINSSNYDLLVPGFFEDEGFQDEGIEGD